MINCVLLNSSKFINQGKVLQSVPSAAVHVDRWIILEIHTVRACLHGGGGPQVGEVTRLAVVEKWPAFTCKLTTPGSRGDFT